MKTLMIALVACLAFTSLAFAEETMGQKTEKTLETGKEKAKELASEAKVETKKAARKTKRMAKKSMHRVEEATCMEGDAACAAKKMKNRMEEGKDTTVDKMKDVKDEMSK
ncbi:MAG: hypothetical protein KUL82_00870 [Bdellovibrio sp.]|nr:hypothetical protein [Bdellovibrio sp.]